MKRFLPLMVVLALLVTTVSYVAVRRHSPAASVNAPLSSLTSWPASSSAAPRTPVSLTCEEGMRAVWINFYEMGELCRDKNAESYRAAVDALLDKCLALHLNSVIVHVRSHSDSFYPSAIFPWSAQVAGSQGAGVDFDPLALFIEAAHAKGISFHAWVNPYRVLSGSSDFSSLSSDNPAKRWLDDAEGEGKGLVVQRADGLYYNPCAPAVRRLIIDGVREIVANYAVDGIHFDDYFYPTSSEDFDREQYAAYQSGAGESAMPLDAWRRTQTNLLISGVYSAIKQVNPDVLFGVSPQASIEKNQTGCFADVERWASEAGYVDYLCPQIYFGFEYPQEDYRFEHLLSRWCELVTCPSVSLWVGLAPYKLGNTDAGSGEWVGSTDLLSRQIQSLKASGRCEGVAFYNASTLFADTEQAAAERDNITKSLSE